MGYWTRTLGGAALTAAGLGAFVYLLLELMHTGTCASGGPYASARECPGDIALQIGLLFPSLLAFLVGGWLVVSRGRRSVKPGLPPKGPATLSNPVPLGVGAPPPRSAERSERDV